MPPLSPRGRRCTPEQVAQSRSWKLQKTVEKSPPERRPAAAAQRSNDG
jgi:hypothetical protein